MKFRPFILFSIAVLGFCSGGKVAYAWPGTHEYGLLCQECFSQSDFVDFAVENAPRLIGESTITVANMNTNQIYVVVVEWERENQVWYSAVLDAQPGSQNLKNGFIKAKALFGGTIVFVSAPTENPGLFQSWTTSELAAVNYRIVGNPDVLQATHAASLWDALELYFSEYPVIVFVFENGDTAQYQVNYPGQAGLCCTYIEGSAKDKDGNPIDAPETNPGDLNIGFGGGAEGGLSDYDYSAGSWRWRCSFMVDENDYVVEFLGCARLP